LHKNTQEYFTIVAYFSVVKESIYSILLTHYFEVGKESAIFA